MAVDFDEVRFPTGFRLPIQGTPRWNTDVTEEASGHRTYVQNWDASLWDFQVTMRNDHPNFDALFDFWEVRAGRAIGFRLFNPFAHYAAGQLLGVGDDAEVDFQLKIIRTSGPRTRSKNITKPIHGETLTKYGAVNVIPYLDGVAQGSGWSVDTTTGIITFSVAPPTSVVVSADFYYDTPVHFSRDDPPLVGFTTTEDAGDSIRKLVSDWILPMEEVRTNG